MAVSRTWYAFSCKKTHLGRGAGWRAREKGVGPSDRGGVGGVGGGWVAFL